MSWSATSPGLRGSFCSKNTLLSCRTSSMHPSTNPETCLGSCSLLPAEFFDRPVNKAPVEEILERYRCFEITNFLEKLNCEVVGFFGDVSVNAPQTWVRHLI